MNFGISWDLNLGFQPSLTAFQTCDDKGIATCTKKNNKRKQEER